MMMQRRERIEIVMLMIQQSFDLVMRAVKIATQPIEESIDLLVVLVIELMSLDSTPDGWNSIPDGWKSIPDGWMKMALVTST